MKNNQGQKPCNKIQTVLSPLTVNHDINADTVQAQNSSDKQKKKSASPPVKLKLKS